eukprot:UN01097
MLLLFPFFYLICFLKTGCFFLCHMFHQNWLLQMLPFWVLSILCFVVKNDLRETICCLRRYFFSPFSPHVFH